MQTTRFRVGECVGLAHGVDACRPESFVCVDVAQTCNEVLVEEQWFDATTPP